MARLAEKRTLITGAGSGLGRRSALRFAEEGALVACCDTNSSAARETAAMIVTAGGTAIAVTADVSIEADADRMVDETVTAFGGLDVAFANAGITGKGRAGDIELERWNRVIAVNLTGVWLTCRAALRQFLVQGTPGTLIATASTAGISGYPGIAAYAAAKAGVVGLVRQIAIDYGPDDIRINAICPGMIPTSMTRSTYRQRLSGPADDATVDAGINEEHGAIHPLRRVGSDRDVADAAVYLASDESNWVTGTTLVVDGGVTAG